MLAAFCVLASLASQSQGPVHYRVEAQTVATVDLSSMGQAPQNQTMTSMALLTTTVRDTAGGKVAHIVIDSITFDGGGAEAQMPPEMLVSAKGAFFDGYVVNGRFKTPPSSSVKSVPATQVAAGVLLMFPGARSGMKVGDSWTDTVRTDTTTSAGAANGQTTIAWTVQSIDNGVITLNAITAATGTVGAGAAQMQIQSNGKQTATSTVAGPASSGLTTSQGETSMNVGGNAIPIRVSTTVKLTQLP
jgi:hypothetical protein